LRARLLILLVRLSTCETTSRTDYHMKSLSSVNETYSSAQSHRSGRGPAPAVFILL